MNCRISAPFNVSPSGGCTCCAWSSLSFFVFAGRLLFTDISSVLAAGIWRDPDLLLAKSSASVAGAALFRRRYSNSRRTGNLDDRESEHRSSRQKCGTRSSSYGGVPVRRHRLVDGSEPLSSRPDHQEDSAIFTGFRFENRFRLHCPASIGSIQCFTWNTRT